jgi:hypothetical protein
LRQSRLPDLVRLCARPLPPPPYFTPHLIAAQLRRFDDDHHRVPEAIKLAKAGKPRL